MSKEVLLLKAGDWQAGVDPDYGANLVFLRYAGRDVLRPLTQGNTDPFLVGAPLLLPANRTAGGRFAFAGKTYQLPVNEERSGAHLHGQLYHAPFSVVCASDEEAVLWYENQGECYPFPFAITVHYRLEEMGLTSVYHIQNTGKTPMPLTFGLHTTFQEPERFRVPLASCQEKDARHIPTGRYVPLSPRETAYTQGSPSREIPISGYYRAGGNVAQIGGFTYEATGFDHWVLYNGGGQGGFLCVEPQLGAVDGLNRQSGCPVISPGAHLALKTRLFAPIQQRLAVGLGGCISRG